MRWIENAEIADNVLTEWLKQFSFKDLKNFTHKPNNSDEYRILAYDEEKLVLYGFLGKTSSFGYIALSEYRNKGLGHEVMKRIIDMAKTLKRKDIDSEVFCDNKQSISIMKKAGFSFYGPIYLVHKELI